jgi:translation elongation factor EF-Tu-like GTPase
VEEDAGSVVLEKGGRHTLFVVGYTPQFFFYMTDVTEQITDLDATLIGRDHRML